jgi:dihydroorotate dehydrogenase
MALLRSYGRLAPARLLCPPAQPGLSLMGLRFPNRIGLAAGFDKNGTAIDGLGALGFGFVEVGTVTPRPQPGQPKPRLFRLTADRSLINRMGFPSDGAEQVTARIAARRFRGIVGINIGKNAATAIDQALDDYLSALHMVFPAADYLSINISSPNTSQLRSLQERDRLRPFLLALVAERDALSRGRPQRPPLLVKLSPDLTDEDLQGVAEAIRDSRIDGVIATNTTTTRPRSLSSPRAREAGGLSGPALRPLSIRTVATLRRQLGPDFPIIGVGGIDSVEAAHEMFDAGAQLIQIYTAAIFQGVGLIHRLTT